MIVVSGVLVLVAIVLLVAGLFSRGLTLVYLSIGVSLVSALLLLVGSYQRRRSTPTAEPVTLDKGGDDLDLALVSSSDEEPLEPLADESEALGGGAGEVWVVSGRPRYHVQSCRFLAGRDDSEPLDADEARELGFTACGVCRPDEALVAAARPVQPEPREATSVDVDDTYSAEPLEGTSVAGTSATAAVGTAALPDAGADDDDLVDDVPAAPVRASRAVKAPTKTAAKATSTATRAARTTAPVKATAARAAAPAKAASAASRISVVVIPARDKFHTDACRFVRGVAGTETMSKAAATKQGYVPCGVCKP